MLPAADRYDDLLSRFAWDVPARYNIGVDVCDKWADGSGRLALIHETAQGDVVRITFDDLRNASNRLANSFARAGLRRGDRIGIFLAQNLKRPSRTSPHTSSAQSRCRSSRCSASMRSNTGSRTARRLRSSPMRPATRKSRRCARLPALHTVYCIGDDAPDQPDG